MTHREVPDANRIRPIVRRTGGQSHGPVTRLMSPSDLGQVLKPFVFLDLFDITQTSFTGVDLHPHSGIATLTYLFEGSSRYEDTSGATGTLSEGSVEWFKAGAGGWHGGGPTDHARTRGFQLWIALPPEHELGPVESVNLPSEAISSVGPAKVLLGEYQQAKSPIPAPFSVNYLAVRLEAGDAWCYHPPPRHTVGWLAVAKGLLVASEAVGKGELAIFASSTDAIACRAATGTEFVVGSAPPHAWNLVLGEHSVHTSRSSLLKAQQQIDTLEAGLRRTGRL